MRKLMDVLLFRLFEDLRPKDGWLPLLLILGIGSTVVSAVLDANWVPEDGIVIWVVVLGLILGITVAKRPISSLPAWLLLVGYGIAITVILLAHLLPPPEVLSTGAESDLTYIRQNLILFGDRAGGWLQAVVEGESSEETIVFAFGLGLLSWLLITYTAWATYRRHNPLNGLILIGLALGFNILYSNAIIWTLAVFIGLSVLLIAAIHMVDMHQVWDQQRVDYPTGINIELMMAGGGVALVLLIFSFAIPAINIKAITRAFVNRPSVQQAEETLGRVFAGVNYTQENLPGRELERASGGGGSLPRSFLLGNPPELAETLVMTATVQGEEAAENANWPIHWRAYSYDIYTGRGWAVSNERQETIGPGEPLAIPAVESPRILTQSVHWLLGNTRTRYTLGLPLRFDQTVTAYWRGLSDLSQVRGGGTVYAAESQVINAAPADLQAATLAGVPETILARYTALPDNVPDRIYQLAAEAAADSSGPYDQTKAIEAFLRQYPYSLDVPLPPSNQDLVDFFLFNLQTGYCDYYASAMVVMARSLGIPARFATGFLAQMPDEKGVQTVYALNAHSWAEIYFAGYGWVEFEPTAAFPTQSQVGELSEFLTSPPNFPVAEPIELPPPAESGPPSILTNRYFLLVLGLFVAAFGVLIWLVVGRPFEPDSVISIYGRLQRSANRIGQSTPKSQTPVEFDAAFGRRLGDLAKQSQLAGRILRKREAPVRKVATLPEEADRLTDLFMARQYSKPGGEEKTAEDAHQASLIWQRIRRRLLLLAILNRVRRFPND
ncbi:MAG: transglutaminase domain-containing protein [Candidatus Promineifilaceae bacterium]